MPSPTTRISERHRVEGVVRAAEDLAVAGHLRGRLESDHAVVVEASGVLEADVLARTVLVEGVVVGDVAATEEVHVAATGQVQGDIRAGRLVLKPGGRISGRVETGADVTPARGLARRAAVGSSRPAPARPDPEPEPTPPPEEAPAPSAGEAAPPAEAEPTSTPTEEPAAAPAEEAIAEGEAMSAPEEAPEVEVPQATTEDTEGEVVEPSDSGWSTSAEPEGEVVEAGEPEEETR